MNFRMSQCQKEEAEAVECGAAPAACRRWAWRACASDREGEMELDTSRDLGTFSLLSPLIKEGFLEEEKVKEAEKREKEQEEKQR